MGSFFTCATFTGGSVRCWGNNAAGTLGVGTSGTSCFFPGLIPRFGMVTSVALGGFFACAGRGDATVWCWGNNSSGQLGTGIGTPAMATTPMRNLALGGTVYAGYDHSCVVLPSGEVQCWGSNSYGQLGGGGLARMPQYFSPIRAFVGSVRALALGQGHSCALYATGTVGCWGNNTDGQAGQPASTMELRDATAVPGLNDVQKLVAGWIFTCALGRDGQVRCWGSNDSGELGRGALTPTRDGTPGVVVGLTDVTDLSAAGAGVCALRRDGTVWCWGRAEVATSTMDPTVPSRVPGLTGVQALWGRCAWLGGADLRCWGPNPGDGTANAMGRVATVRW
jgi:alpha-tubulin suppressor-like RCC1 family protein